MKISAHTLITNPHSSGYLAYLPAIQSFLDFADEVVVVDGGSTDESLDKLKTLRGQEKLIVVSSERTHWGSGDNWEWPQIAINRQVGFELCEGDWAIHFDADYVLPDFERDALLAELGRYKNEGILFAFKVMGFRNGKYIKTKVLRKWCVNKKLALERRIPIAYGLDHELGGLDNPILPEKQSCFIDSVNKRQKPYYLGPQYPYPRSRVLDVTLYRYGHFFFTSEQLLFKEQRIENALAMHQGRTPIIVPVDQRSYRLIDVNTFLESNRHPKTMVDFIKRAYQSYSKRDIVGLRDYEYSWVRKLLATYSRVRERYQRMIVGRLPKLVKRS